MCVPSAPKAPAVQPIPVRQPVILPDGGDPNVIAGIKNPRRLATSAMVLTGQGGTLGSPSTTGPLGGR